jgi:hypothetical protein
MARKTTTGKTTTTRKRTTTSAPPTQEARVDLMKELLAQLKAEGIKPTVRWSPTNKYASLLVDGKNLGYVFAQTSSGIKVKAGVTLKELGRDKKGWKDISHDSPVYAVLGFFATPTELKRATAALKLAAAKQAKAREAKAAKSG